MPRRPVTALTLLFALPAAAQPDVDILIRVEPVAGTTWQITAQNFPRPGDLAISSVWSEANFEITSQDGSISDLDFNPGYLTSTFGPPDVTDIGNGFTVFAATMPGGSLFIGPDNDDSNPLFVMSFDYTGTADDLSMRLIGINSITFVDPDNSLFGSVENFTGSPPLPFLTRSVAVEVVPTPGTAACLALASLTATRRRR